MSQSNELLQSYWRSMSSNEPFRLIHCSPEFSGFLLALNLSPSHNIRLEQLFGTPSLFSRLSFQASPIIGPVLLRLQTSLLDEPVWCRASLVQFPRSYGFDPEVLVFRLTIQPVQSSLGQDQDERKEPTNLYSVQGIQHEARENLGIYDVTPKCQKTMSASEICESSSGQQVFEFIGTGDHSKSSANNNNPHGTKMDGVFIFQWVDSRPETKPEKKLKRDSPSSHQDKSQTKILKKIRRNPEPLSRHSIQMILN
eukprot:TRINITY_DN6540_c0_g1_i1.p1 TRINITY_DN6540_c0_g1~~TRINITY_DN6540_c0_g1_i1.p1  ORF type:complete len:254 (-),score=38.16 TRINITY_DN6540_c0_g1_i1:272-1033(-)